MQTILKDLIVKYIQNNNGDFQLVNNTIAEFKKYIYTPEGEYLVGGQYIAQFIKNFISLYTNN